MHMARGNGAGSYRRPRDDEIATPAGIRQAPPIHHNSKHLQRENRVIKGLMYVVTDQGRWWKKVIGSEKTIKCQYGEIQNAVLYT